MALAITSLDAYGIRPYSQAVTITGTDFDASQGSNKVYVADGTNFGSATLIEQTAILSWSDTSIVVAGLDPEMFARGVQYLFVETGAGNTTAEPFFLGVRDVRVVQGSFLTPTSTGNLDISHPRLLGDSKVKGIFLRANLVTSESAADDAAIHIGMSDGTNDYAITTNTEDGVLDAYRQNWNDRCLSMIPVGGSNTPTVVATFTGAVTDGFRLNFSTVSGSAYLVHYIAFAGEDVQAEVAQSLVSGSPISGLAFRPEFGIVIADGQGLNGNGNIFLASVGMFTDDLDQFQVGWYGPDNGASARPPLAMSSGAGVALQVVGTSKTWQMTVTSIQSGGFTWSGSNGDNIYALVVNLSNIGTAIEQFTKTSGGSDPVTHTLPDLGFIPQSLGIGTAWRTSTGLSTGDALASLGFWDMFNQGHISWLDEDVDEPNNSHQRSQSDSLAMKMLTNGGTDVEVFGAQVGISTDPDIILNPNDASADIMFAFAFERVSA